MKAFSTCILYLLMTFLLSSCCSRYMPADRTSNSDDVSNIDTISDSNIMISDHDQDGLPDQLDVRDGAVLSSPVVPARRNPVFLYYDEITDSDGKKSLESKTVDGTFTSRTEGGKSYMDIVTKDNKTIVCEGRTVDGNLVYVRIGGDAPINPR